MAAGLGTSTFGPAEAGLQGQAPMTPAAQAAMMLYRPRSGSVSIGARLRQMHREGRGVITSQRGRWQYNSEMYRGNQWLTPPVAGGSGQLHRLAPTEQLPGAHKRDTVNLLRGYTDGRVAMLAGKRPPSRVEPISSSRQDADACRLAQTIIDWEWDNEEGLNIGRHMRRMALAAERDGIAWSCVMFNRAAGPQVPMMLERAGNGWQPVTEAARMKALEQQDPLGESLWKLGPWTVGEMSLRVVRSGALSVDPAMDDDYKSCKWIIENRVRSIAELEQETGLPVADILKKSGPKAGQAARVPENAQGADGYDRKVDVDRETLVCELFHTAGGEGSEFPMGAHLIWCHDAPDQLLVAEPWIDGQGRPRPLPYYPYTPRPDGGNMIRCRGIVDELAPLQRQYNRWMSRYSMWLDLASAPPLVLTGGGGIRSGSIFSDKRIVHVNPGAAPPMFMPVPSDPAAHLQNMLAMLEDKMAEVAVQSEATRGNAPNNRDWSSTSLNTLIAQDEAQLSGTEGEFKAMAQWTVTRLLEGIAEFYVVPRQIRIAGADDLALRAFRGSMIRGAQRWKITGPIMPKTRAERLQMLGAFMQFSGGRFDPTPYAAEIIDGDVETIVTKERGATDRQARENALVYSYAMHPEIDRAWMAFTDMRDEYARLLQEAQIEIQARTAEMGEAPMDASGFLASLGVNPPRVLDLVRFMGMRAPEVLETDPHHMHVAEIRAATEEDSYDSLHPFVQQALREHLHDHIGALSRNAMAMASQSPPMLQGKPGAQPPTNSETEAPA